MRLKFKVFFCLSLTTFLLAATANADEYTEPLATPSEEINVEEENSWGHAILMYIPNRVLDVFDIFRARVRVGPGIGFGVRATEPISAEVSSYATIYAGLPGPRRERTIRSPIGAEMYNGLGVSYLKVETEKYGPHYSSTEFGLDLQAILVGASIGIDPLELLDFITGFVGIEVVEDDL